MLLTVDCPVCNRSTPALAPEHATRAVCTKCHSVLSKDQDVWRQLSADDWVLLPVDVRTTLQAAQDMLKEAKHTGVGALQTDATPGTDGLPHRVVLSLTPWLVCRKLLEESGESGDKDELMGKGLSAVGRAIAARPDTDPLEDARLLVPVVYAQAYMATGGDHARMLEMLNEHVGNVCREEGVDIDKLTLEVVVL